MYAVVRRYSGQGVSELFEQLERRNDEVRDLIAKVPTDAPAWKASGYGAMRDHVEGRCDLSTARQRVIIETRQYAKRQRTWFRNQLPEAAVTRVNPEDSRARAVVREWWEKAE